MYRLESDDNAPEISVSIVSMNNPAYLTRCLETLYANHQGLRIEVFVVFYRTPSSVVDDVAARFPQIRVVLSPDTETRGYGENQNLGSQQANGKYVVILNDDIAFHDDALGQLLSYHKAHPEIGALVPRLLNEDGTLQSGLRGALTPFTYALHAFKLTSLLARSPRLRPYLFDAPDHDVSVPTETACGTGAFFWVTRELLNSVGYMDERYFLAPDDIDLSIRLKNAGARMVYLPHVAATHTGSVTLSKVFSKVLPASLFDDVALFERHYGRTAALMTLGVRAASSTLSAAYWAAKWARGDRVRAEVMLRGYANVARFLVRRPSTSKEIFLRSW